MVNVKILGTGVYIPDKIVDNNDLAKIVETNDEWIVARTGISQRHVSSGETTWSMGVMSAKNALEDAGILPEQIDAVIGVTISPDYFYPSLSCIVAKKLGIKNPLTVDVSAACSGFVYALDMARRYLMDDDYKNVLVVSSENLTKQTDYTDRGTCILFGDASASVVLTKSDGLFESVLRSQQDGMESLVIRALESRSPFIDKDNTKKDDLDGLFKETNDDYCYMIGQDVYRFAVKSVPGAIKDVLKKANLNVDDIDIFIFHQANLRIIEKIADMLKIDESKVYSNIQEYGNTSSVSIPICIHECIKSGRIKKGDKVVMTGYGAGLTYGSVLMEIN